MASYATRQTVIALRRLGLTKPAFWAWERYKVARAPRGYQAFDGLPIPPPLLQVQVVGHSNPDRFLLYGLLGKQIVTDKLHQYGVGGGKLLDFGCGCGRTARFLRDWPGQLHGSDYNPAAIEWCQSNLPFLHAQLNQLEPPLPYADESFDAVYALSVWTHLTEELQHGWMTEMRRVLKPGGVLVFTTQGDHFRPALDHIDRAHLAADYDAGRPVVADEDMEGSNRCSAYAPASWVKRELLEGWEEVEHTPSGSVMTANQDLWVARSPS